MKILLINRHPPYGHAAARDSIDVALTGATLNQDVQLLFMGDGVYQLLPQHNASLLEQKNIGDLLSMLNMYGITQVYAQKKALEERSLSGEDLTIATQTLSDSDIQTLIAQQDCTLNF